MSAETQSYLPPLEPAKTVNIEPSEQIPPQKVIVNGKGRFGRDVYDELKSRGHIIVGVIAPKEENDVLRLAALQDGIEPINLGAIDFPRTQAKIKELGADIAVAVDVQKIIPPVVANAPKNGTLLFHPAFSPMHAGRTAINRSILAGDKALGVACLWIEDEGKAEQLDSGGILSRVAITFEDENITAGGAYRDGIAALGVTLMCDAVDLVAVGRAPHLPQEPELSSYEPPLTKEGAKIDWNKTSDVIHNLIRGSQNSPGAWTRIPEMGEEQIINIFDASKIPGKTDFEPGRIISAGYEGITISTSDGAILIKTLQESNVKRNEKGDIAETSSETEKGKKIPALEFMKEKNLRPRMRFNDPQEQ